MPEVTSNKEQSSISLYDLTASELESFFLSIGEADFRAKQVMDFLYRHPVKTIDEITTLSLELREKLSRIARIAPLKLRFKVESDDGVIKHAYDFKPQSGRGALLESVWMPSEFGDMDTSGESGKPILSESDEAVQKASRYTLCISSQLGCAAGCAFCATGSIGLKGQLSAGEIVYQVVHCLELYERLPDNVLFMGMGEPMHNFDAVCAAVENMTHKDGLAMSEKRIVVSSCGELERLGAFHKRFPRVRLAISLNAGTDSMRSKLMPVNDRYGVKAIEAFVKTVDLAPGERITIEYVVISGMSDIPSQMNALESMLVSLGNRVRVNLIPYNQIDRKRFESASIDRIYAMQRRLRELGVMVFIRRNRGAEASAACGQLAGRM